MTDMTEGNLKGWVGPAGQPNTNISKWGEQRRMKKGRRERESEGAKWRRRGGLLNRKEGRAKDGANLGRWTDVRHVMDVMLGMRRWGLFRKAPGSQSAIMHARNSCSRFSSSGLIGAYVFAKREPTGTRTCDEFRSAVTGIFQMNGFWRSSKHL